MTILWMNGAFLDASEARIDPSDRGFLLSEGLFETIAIRSGCFIEFDAHIFRLSESAQFLALSVEFSLSQLRQAAQKLVHENAFGKTDYASLRITLSGGPAPRGLLAPAARKPTLLMTAAVLSAPAKNLKAVTSSICINETSPTASLKHTGYLDKILAKHEAHERGADEALLLNTKGRLGDATTANVFLCLDDGTVVTPPVMEGALPGIVRARLLKLAALEGIDLRESTIPALALSQAQEILLTNSLIGVCPLSELDGRRLNEKGATGERLRKAYDAFVKKECQS